MQRRRVYKYYDLVMASFVTVLLCANIIGAEKVVNIYGFSFGAGVLFFPISYIFNDILTEVYGYSRSRKVIWAGFGALIFASIMSWFVRKLPPDPSWPYQEAYDIVFGQTPRIAIASIVAFWAGEFTNSFVLAKMKLLTRGRFLWTRTIGSTIAGEAVDSLIFYPVAFYGFWTNELLIKVMITNYAIKVGWEALITPITYKIVNFLKKAENEDYYDWNTDFNPFKVEV
ncbi:MAG: queuosine precursor transporter [Candidatus Kryptonium sp.]|nr:queuosine precursor transporter [Candidatus Kryptonium sp.]MCX7761860.1 queuosine precursor transporter [Candidatus Kryptonium sp.]MDW8108808.1 queuosine precursor transporter [Candidatus Kryptonium sp.]